MSDPFFARPILNSPYEYPRRHWELDPAGQPTQRIIENRRRAEFVTSIPKPQKRKTAARQDAMVFAEGQGLSTAAQQYDVTSIINAVRQNVDAWRSLPPGQQQVTPETARLLQHWRQHCEAKRNNAAARLWISGLEAVNRKLGLSRVRRLRRR